MFPNWTGWKTVKLALAALIGIVPPLVPAADQTLVSSGLAVVMALVVFLSGSAVGPAIAKGAK